MHGIFCGTLFLRRLFLRRERAIAMVSNGEGLKPMMQLRSKANEIAVRFSSSYSMHVS
jgi:hypothetical protein